MSVEITLDNAPRDPAELKKDPPYTRGVLFRLATQLQLFQNDQQEAAFLGQPQGVMADAVAGALQHRDAAGGAPPAAAAAVPGAQISMGMPAVAPPAPAAPQMPQPPPPQPMPPAAAYPPQPAYQPPPAAPAAPQMQPPPPPAVMQQPMAPMPPPAPPPPPMMGPPMGGPPAALPVAPGAPAPQVVAAPPGMAQPPQTVAVPGVPQVPQAPVAPPPAPQLMAPPPMAAPPMPAAPPPPAPAAPPMPTPVTQGDAGGTAPALLGVLHTLASKQDIGHKALAAVVEAHKGGNALLQEVHADTLGVARIVKLSVQLQLVQLEQQGLNANTVLNLLKAQDDKVVEAILGALGAEGKG